MLSVPMKNSSPTFTDHKHSQNKFYLNKVQELIQGNEAGALD